MKKDTILIIVLVAVLIGIVFLIINKKLQHKEVQNKETQVTNSSNIQTESAMNKKQYDQPPAMQIDQAKKYQAVLQTSQGEITIELNAQAAPITVNNFVFLAGEGFYDGTVIHRIIEGFMIQGGDPTGTGSGGPGYRFDDEPIEGEYVRGTVAMANAGPNTNGSQFFIMHQDNSLPKNYVIFGQVSAGMGTVDAIASSPVTQSPSGEQSKPISPITIQSIKIVEQ